MQGKSMRNAYFFRLSGKVGAVVGLVLGLASCGGGGGTGSPATAVSVAPTVIAIAPSQGVTVGGTSVTVSVADATGVTSVAVGGVNLSSFLVTGPNTVVGVTGAHPAGTVDVTATNSVGTSAPLAGAYLYRDPIVPADLSALNLTMRFAAGTTIVPHDETVYMLPTVGFPASPIRVSFVWFGTASAGLSGHRMAFNSSWDLNPTVGGVQPMHLGSLGGLSTIKRLTGDTLLQSYRLDNTIPAGNDSGLVWGATQGFGWVLVRTPTSIPLETGAGGNWQVLGGGGNQQNIEIGNEAGNILARFRLASYINGTSADADLSPVTTPIALDSWMVIMVRYNNSTNRKEIRVNGGTWVSAFTDNLSHTQDANGSVYIPSFAPPNTEVADVGVMTSTVNDATADAIYMAIRALYPAAGLPNIAP